MPSAADADVGEAPRERSRVRWDDDCMDRDLGSWEPLSPREVSAALGGMPRPWWIAGGWAIDLHLGQETRAHADTDVLVLRDDQLEVQRRLVGWDLQAADPPGTLRPWSRERSYPLACATSGAGVCRHRHGASSSCSAIQPTANGCITETHGSVGPWPNWMDQARTPNAACSLPTSSCSTRALTLERRMKPTFGPCVVVLTPRSRTGSVTRYPSYLRYTPGSRFSSPRAATSTGAHVSNSARSDRGMGVRCQYATRDPIGT